MVGKEIAGNITMQRYLKITETSCIGYLTPMVSGVAACQGEGCRGTHVMDVGEHGLGAGLQSTDSLLPGLPARVAGWTYQMIIRCGR